MEERKIFTEKDFPIQSRMLYIWIPIIIYGLFTLFVNDKNFSSQSYFSQVFIVVIIAIFYWKRKGFLIDEKGIRINPRVFGGTHRLILYGDIERVYVRQRFFDSRLGIAEICIESKLPEPNQLQGILREIFPINKEKHTVCISGLLPSDAELIRGIMQERISNPSAEDAIQYKNHQ